MQNKLLFKYTVTGIIFVSLAGTLNHFLYDWSNQNRFIGLFTAVNESTWEHMKLLFFPMIIYSIFLYVRLNKQCPQTNPAILLASVTGTILIPVIFYTYTGILGYMINALNIAIFYISVLTAFIIFYYIASRRKLHKYNLVLLSVITLFTCMFFLFSYNTPDLGIFIDPTK